MAEIKTNPAYEALLPALPHPDQKFGQGGRTLFEEKEKEQGSVMRNHLRLRRRLPLLLYLIFVVIVFVQVLQLLAVTDWRTGTITAADESTVQIAGDDGQVYTLEYAKDRFLAPGARVRFRCYENRLLDLWYENEHVILKNGGS